MLTVRQILYIIIPFFITGCLVYSPNKNIKHLGYTHEITGNGLSLFGDLPVILADKNKKHLLLFLLKDTHLQYITTNDYAKKVQYKYARVNDSTNMLSADLGRVIFGRYDRIDTLLFTSTMVIRKTNEYSFTVDRVPKAKNLIYSSIYLFTLGKGRYNEFEVRNEHTPYYMEKDSSFMKNNIVLMPLTYLSDYINQTQFLEKDKKVKKNVEKMVSDKQIDSIRDCFIGHHLFGV